MGNGLLLLNLGTPNNATVSGVRSFLREFLTDKRVINLPAVLRYALIYGFILPFRPKKSAKAYAKIWTDQGSPLLLNSYKLSNALRAQLNSNWTVETGMRYGSPSIKDALKNLAHCETITVVPLYPQYSSAATGSSLEEVFRVISTWEHIPSLTIISDFYQHPAYIKAQAQLIKDQIQKDDYLLFSYHGIPERQIIASGCTKVCQKLCPPISEKNSTCYKAQCEETSRLLATELNLDSTEFSSAFQSRLGRTPWIKPYADEVLKDLAAQGVKNLVVACPSFVADCLETLEEIGIRSQEQWQALGGTRFTLIPSLNANPLWVHALLEIIKYQS